MKVYKFGGASVRNADGVQNLLKIIGDERDLFIIVSAMGIRIEDDVLITEDGAVCLSEDIIRTTEDIEAYMAEHKKN